MHHNILISSIIKKIETEITKLYKTTKYIIIAHRKYSDHSRDSRSSVPSIRIPSPCSWSAQLISDDFPYGWELKIVHVGLGLNY